MFVQLHLRTVFLGSSFLSVVLFVCMTVVAIQGKTYRGFFQWSIATLTLALGMALIGLRGTLPSYLTFNVASVAILTTLILIHDGLTCFTDARLTRKFYAIPIVLLVVPDFVWKYVIPDREVRVIVSSALVLLCSIGVLYFYYKRIVPTYTRNWLVPVGLIVQASVFTIYLVRTMHSSSRLSSIMRTDGFDAFLVVLIFSMTVLVILGLIVLNYQRTEIELRDAMSEVKTLRGIIPVCASCKKIRDDTGYWNAVDAYLQLHTQIQVTHGLCPECARKLYPRVFGKEERSANG